MSTLPRDAAHHANAIDSVSRALAQWIVERQHERDPGLAERYGATGRRMWRVDVQNRLQQLVQAVGVESPELFLSSVAWAKVAFAGRGVDIADLRLSLECTAAVLDEHLPAAVAGAAVPMIRQALESLEALPATATSLIAEIGPLQGHATAYLTALLDARRDDAFVILRNALEAGHGFAGICAGVIVPAMHEVGRLWHLNEITVADEHCCTAASSSLLARLFELERDRHPPKSNGRTAVVASVGGDLHELGARIVSDLLELDGWRCIYLGANMPAIEVVAALLHHEASLLAISASTNLSVLSVKELVDEVRSTDGLSAVRVIVGGAPFTAVEDLWRRVGADGSARDAAEAVAMAGRLVPNAASV